MKGNPKKPQLRFRQENVDAIRSLMAKAIQMELTERELFIVNYLSQLASWMDNPEVIEMQKEKSRRVQEFKNAAKRGKKV